MSKIVDDAIAKVTASVKRLAKEEKNQHGGYKFAGIDDFLEMTGKLCGDAGLNVLMDEEDVDIIPEFFSTRNGLVAALKMRFAITLSSGGEEKGPYRRSILIPSNMGSQAFGAGQSYVLKQFLRATFQIPTGDKEEDIDSHDTGTMQPQQRGMLDAPMNGPAKPAPKRLTGIHKTVASLREGIRAFKSEIESCEDIEQFEGCLLANVDLIDQVQKEKSDWWDGDGGNFAGLEADIAVERKRIEEKV